MRYANRLLSSRLARFLIVGAGNSIVNFVVLNAAFYLLHQNKIISSILATSCAILVSFAFNRNFVFRDRARPFEKFVRFAAVSAGGVLLIQTSVYAVCIVLLQYVMSSNFVVINLSNLIASFVVMFWNYHGYRLLVFKSGTQRDSTIKEAT